jgi:ABC-type dipeptide/oligopeptide/nickel transport system permease component
MGQYIVRRLLAAIPVVLGVVIVVFVTMRLIPGDPIALQYYQSQGVGSFEGMVSQEVLDVARAAYNLDKSVPHQLLLYMGDLFTGDLGDSIKSHRPVGDIIKDHAPATLQLTFAGMFVALIIGIGAGIVSAVKHNTIVDYAAQVFAVSGVSIPTFVVGILLLYAFAIQLNWFPVISNGFGKQLVLPAISLGVAAAAILARLTRSAMLDVMGRDYIRTARAKGLRERVVIWGHALKNAMIPVITIVGLEFGGLLAGSIVIEVVFIRQGLGFQLINAISVRDYPLVQGLVILSAVVYTTVNILVDVTYTYLDPRVRLQGQSG